MQGLMQMAGKMGLDMPDQTPGEVPGHTFDDLSPQQQQEFIQMAGFQPQADTSLQALQEVLMHASQTQQDPPQAAPPAPKKKRKRKKKKPQQK